MDANAIIEAVKSIGFPAVFCFILLKQNNKLSDTIADLKETLSENTTMLKILTSRMKGE